MKKKQPSVAERMGQTLTRLGFAESGGGNGFTSYTDGVRTFYVFEDDSTKGPDSSHWAEIDDTGRIVAGGFEDHDVAAYLAGLGRRGPRPFGGLPGEAAVVERIKALRAEGLSLAKIAAALNAEQAPTRTGTGWSKTMVKVVLDRG